MDGTYLSISYEEKWRSIYGFDIIAGKKKVTGAFHDFSPLLKKEHPLTRWFIEENKW